MRSRASESTDSVLQSFFSNRPSTTPRHLRRSSSLLALETLIAPSPTLTTSDTLCSVRSGEIPIILSFLTTNSADSVKLEDDSAGSQLPSDSCLKPGVRELARFSPMAAFFPMSARSASIGTAAFGSRSSEGGDASFNADSNPCVSVVLGVSPSCTLSPPYYDNMQGEESKFTISAYLTSRSEYGDLSEGLVSSKSEQVLTKSSQEMRKGEAPGGNGVIGTSISFTITEPLEDMANKSPYLTASRSLSTIQFSTISPRASTAFSPSPSTPSFTPPLTPLSAERTPTQATFLQRSVALRVKASATPCASPSAAVDMSLVPSGSGSSHSLNLEEQENQIAEIDEVIKPKKLVDNNNTATSPFNSLPTPCLKHAQWLKDCVVELWIDQEGFRAIRPKFYLASVSNGLPFNQERRSSLRNEDPLFSTVAEFLPVSREEHLFHHAALDRPPALHRITVNGGEERDFITRQASLGLKENGVFYVQGTEDYKMNAPPGSGASRIVRLTWRFEYFVSSRTHGPKGKKVPQGEKIFKPLSFSCTPALLSPKRAIKVNVLHVMKKTLLPNLIALKLDPPDLPVPPGSIATTPSSGSLVSVAVSEPQSPFSESSPLTATPARIRAARERRKVADLNFSAAAPIIGPPPRKSSLRKNRNVESQSEVNLAIVQEQGPTLYKRHRTQSVSEQRTSAELSTIKFNSQARAANLARPIISRDELWDIYAQRDIRGRHSISMDIVDNVQITVLPPAPRPKPSGF